jgi:hypothetical protein
MNGENSRIWTDYFKPQTATGYRHLRFCNRYKTATTKYVNVLSSHTAAVAAAIIELRPNNLCAKSKKLQLTTPYSAGGSISCSQTEIQSN